MANLLGSVLMSTLSGSSKPVRAKIGDLDVDVVEAHELKMDSEVTESPAEDGFPIADHVNRKPLTLTVDVIFTDTAVTWSSGTGFNTVLSFVGGGGKGNSRMSTVKNLLSQIYKKGDPITIKLADGIYKDMVMTSAPLPRNVQNGICYKMQLSFTQVRIVSQKTAAVGSKVSPKVSGMNGLSEMSFGAASLTDIGTGIPGIASSAIGNFASAAENMLSSASSVSGVLSGVAGTLPSIGLNSLGIDFSLAGNLSAGKEILAQTTATVLGSSLVPKKWKDKYVQTIYG